MEESPLYSADLAPAPESRCTWDLWSYAAIWVGMAVCIPTWLLASYMIRNGLDWTEALAIIFAGNLIVTVPMILNGRAGARYRLPFAVLGRAAFGVAGVHGPAMVRALVACGWFGVQTWIGGLAIHAIGCAVGGVPVEAGLTPGKFAGFALSLSLNLIIIWRGIDSIRRVEIWAAPLLLAVGLCLMAWGTAAGGGFSPVLRQGGQLDQPTAAYAADGGVVLAPLRDSRGVVKARQFRIGPPETMDDAPWRSLAAAGERLPAAELPDAPLAVQFRRDDEISTAIDVGASNPSAPRFAIWLFWTTAMVGFWATMSISIADITRYSRSQAAQVTGQLLGLPGAMLFYSFISIFVTSAALTGLDRVLIAEDAPWDPVTLLAQFDNPALVVAAQLALLVATITTNVAANVIAPANVFANLLPRRIDFRLGGIITGIAGVLIAPWWLFDRISDLLVFISGLLGPVLGVMLADYYWVRRGVVSVRDLFDPAGAYAYWRGVNPAAMLALGLGVAAALVGYFVPMLEWLYTGSWFSGCLVAFAVYGLCAPGDRANVATHS
ncbi:MAG: NCS1 family nucleobase:cation symporter-1 [Gammaproteobacteria bacterium]|nr:NCS1 family nucleobase:cation symporter-1 [Gammaproteobacteria bacterium]MXW45858.1 NCS1 family nucleobase:cation symporter-1 [Gammaproteobacteria bacterium]MYD00726.1 NCS1 family nucleobase:cation symporter-1 [Gammaproteobacteria bacterium]MYI25486.1 NCS1 family nucleobase:cation symporter-1 [Gammaproteobacteria bacterium]